MSSVIYREAFGFNGQPGNVLCEMEEDQAPRVGDIIKLSVKELTEKKRHVVEWVVKEIYAVPPSQQVVYVAGVTELRGHQHFPIDSEDLEVLSEDLSPASVAALARLMDWRHGLNVPDVNEVLVELMKRLS